LFFGKNQQDQKLLGKLTKIRMEKTQINKIRNKEGCLKQIAMKFRRSCRNVLKTYISANWKIKKKKINFLTHTTYQN
jgi:hypothetical protein